MNAELAATNYLYLEYRAIAVGAKLPAYPRSQVLRIGKLKRIRKKAIRAGIVSGGGSQRLTEQPISRRSRRWPRR
jgi:hypothetical protein